MRSARVLRWLYTMIVYLATPIILYRLLFRSLRARSYLTRWRERFGWFSPPRFNESIVIHAVSVGEFNAALPLIEAMRQRFPELGLVITTITPTGSERVQKVLGDKVFHVYLPYDLPGSIRRFLVRTKPRLLIVMETEIWPNLYFICKRRGVPIVIANARLSERSLRGYGPGQPLAQYAVRCARWIAAQSHSDAQRFIQLGAKPDSVEVVGNVKYDLDVPPALLEEARERREQIGVGRPVWIAASTHEGEDSQVLSAHTRVLARFPDALLILAARHPERFKETAALCRAFGFQTQTRSADGHPTDEAQCFVIDSMGELLQFYACADVAFVAGSLEPIGGHNVLEAAALGVPTVVGPHTFNFAEISAELIDAGACVRIADSEELGATVVRLLSHADIRAAMGRAALANVASRRGAVARIVEQASALI